MITSKDTAIVYSGTRKPLLYSLINNNKLPVSGVVLDYGAGRYNGKEVIGSKGCMGFYRYDPYNLDDTTNHDALFFGLFKYDTIICSNVLNVLQDEVLTATINSIKEMLSCTGVLYISVYENNKSGVGCVTKRGYQRNERIGEYEKILSKHFKTVTKKHGILICTRPIKEV